MPIANSLEFIENMALEKSEWAEKTTDENSSPRGFLTYDGKFSEISRTSFNDAHCCCCIGQFQCRLCSPKTDFIRVILRTATLTIDFKLVLIFLTLRLRKRH